MTTQPKDTKQRPYALKRPCPKCPFRTDVTPYLRRDRYVEIARNIRQGAEFPCHQTTVPDPDDDASLTSGPQTKVCAGALIVQVKNGEANQMMRIAERIGMFSPDDLDLTSPVFDSLDEFARAAGGPEVLTVTTEDGEVLEYETCSVVGEDCENPAGYMVGGAAMDNEDGGQCHPIDDACAVCGDVACPACLSATRTSWGGKVCVNCDDDDDVEIP